jgi:hypothetical protein
MPLDRRERILDWRDELRRVTPLLAELPMGARLAVMEVVATFAREDHAAPADSYAETLNHAVSDAA